MSVIRISRGQIPADRFDEAARRMDEARHSLLPALQRLPGLLHYYVAIDRAAGAMVNVSVWDNEEHAAQMGSLKEMRDLREPFEQLGVHFEPIVNYGMLWEI